MNQSPSVKDGDRIIERSRWRTSSAGKLLEHCKTRLHLNNPRCHGDLGKGQRGVLRKTYRMTGFQEKIS